MYGLSCAFGCPGGDGRAILLILPSCPHDGRNAMLSHRRLALLRNIIRLHAALRLRAMHHVMHDTGSCCTAPIMPYLAVRLAEVRHRGDAGASMQPIYVYVRGGCHSCCTKHQ